MIDTKDTISVLQVIRMPEVSLTDHQGEEG
jgi:hypothetical protein